MPFGSLDGSDDVYINPVTGDLMPVSQMQQPGAGYGAAGRYAGHVAEGVGQMIATPGAIMKENPFKPGTEEHAFFENSRYQAMGNWAPQMAMSMVGSGMPMAEAGALGAGGGALRNKFTGAFKAADAGTDLPKNQMYTNRVRAQAIAENSANAKQPGFPDLVQNAPIDPALVESNLGKLQNPISQQAQMAPPPPQLSARERLDQAFLGGNGQPVEAPRPKPNWKDYLRDANLPPETMPTPQNGSGLDVDFWRRMMPIIMGGK